MILFTGIISSRDTSQSNREILRRNYWRKVEISTYLTGILFNQSSRHSPGSRTRKYLRPQFDPDPALVAPRDLVVVWVAMATRRRAACHGRRCASYNQLSFLGVDGWDSSGSRQNSVAAPADPLPCTRHCRVPKTKS